MLAVCGWLCSLALWGQEPSTAAELGQAAARLEVEIPQRKLYQGERIPVSIRLLYDREIFQNQVQPLFRRSLDLQVQLLIPWWEGLESSEGNPSELPQAGLLPETEASPVPDRGLRMVVNDAVWQAEVFADQILDGRRFGQIGLNRTFLLQGEGELPWQALQLRFSLATEFEESFLHGKIATVTETIQLEHAMPPLTVWALPEAGRPKDFSGAVGQMQMKVWTEERSVVLGTTFSLWVEISGQGSMTSWPPMELPEMAGFHQFGRLQSHPPDRRLIRFELAAISLDVEEIPPISFAYFDPTPPASYRRVQSPAIPLRIIPVDPHRDQVATDFAERKSSIPGWENLFDLKDRSQEETAGSKSTSFWEWPALALPWMLGLTLHRALTARERRRRYPEWFRARRAFSRLQKAVARSQGEPHRHFQSYLAAKLRVPDAAVLSQDLHQQLEQAGLSKALAEEVAACLLQWTAGRYGGEISHRNSKVLLALAEKVEEAMAETESKPW